MLFMQLEILADQPVRKACGDTDLINREAFELQDHHASEVLNIALNGCLGMLGAALDIRELVTGEIEIEDLSFMCLPSTHLVSPAA